MAAFLLYSPGSPFNNASGYNACIATGGSEGAARTAAQAAAPNGETRVHSGWLALNLAGTEHADLTAAGGVVWFQGHGVAKPLRKGREG